MTASATPCDVHEIFRLFTLPQTEFHAQYLLLDTRDYNKHFKRGHISQAFCVRLSSNGKALLDYSKSEYNIKWAVDIWVGRTVYIYGQEGIKKDDPVVTFLVSHGCKAVKYLREEGYSSMEAAYPFICSPSVKANSIKHYPSQIAEGLLYLGDWNHALATDRLQELNIRYIVTIHNHPENLKPHVPKNCRWLQWTVADVETAEISHCFKDTFDWIELARSRKEAVLIHCGAGVSRSATLCIMYLMRRFSWSAQKAKDYCIQRRPVVCPNDGFWRTLCALEPELGISERSDPAAGSGFRGADADDEVLPLPALSKNAAGGKVPIQTITKEQLNRRAEDGDVEPSAKRPRTEGAKKLVTLTLEVHKPEGVFGELVIGPMAPHQRIIFGRLPTNDVVLEHASISRQHASVSLDITGTVQLMDLQSGHGTKLDDTWIKPNAPKQLRKGSTFQFGASTRKYIVKEILQHTS